MSLENFNGETFVAFIDISGFKKKVIANHGNATKTLEDFYNIGYNLLSENGYHNDISGIFVSDCAILYVHNINRETENQKKEQIENCKSILNIVKEINKECIQKKIMLTTSIAYGKFEYEKRIIVRSNTEKNLLVGSAYLDAFADSEKGMDVCSCRLLTNNILFEIEDLNHDYILTKDKNYYYFWWQCKNELEKKNYVKKYKKIKKEYEEEKQELENRKFEDICSLTKEYSNAIE